MSIELNAILIVLIFVFFIVGFFAGCGVGNRRAYANGILDERNKKYVSAKRYRINQEEL